MRSHTIAILLVIFFSLFYRIIFFVGPTVADEFAYLQYAHNAASGQFYILDGTWYAFRYMVFLPAAAAVKFFGVNDHAASLWPLFCSLATIVAIYLLGALLFNKRVGLLAAGLLAIFPLDTLYATHLMPDTIMPFFLALTIYLFLRAETRPEGKRAWIFYLLSGVFLALGYFSREAAPVLFGLFYLAYVVYARKFNPKILLFCLGFIFMVLIEMCFYHFAAGNMFLRWQVLNEFYGVQNSLPNQLYYLRSIFAPLGYFGVFYYLTGLGIIYLVLKKRCRDIAMPLIWLVTSLLYWQFGTMSLVRYSPIFKDARFLTEVSVPALLITAYFLNYWQGSIQGDKYLKYAKRLIICLVFGSLIILPVLLMLKDKVFMPLEFIYKLAKHDHSFQENKANIVAVYRLLSYALPLLVVVGGIGSLIILRVKSLKVGTRLVISLILMVLLPSSFISAAIYSRQYRSSMEKYQKVYRFIAQTNSYPAYFINGRWPVILSYYFQYKTGSHFLKRNFLKYPPENQTPEFKYLQNVKDISEINNAYVVIDKEFLRDFLGGEPPPALAYNVPASWRLEFSAKDVSVYHVDNY